MEHRFCSSCGNPLISHLRPNGALDFKYCTRCGFVDYHNPKPCVGAVIVADGRILLVRRADEPFKGHWDFPGGFLEGGENAEAGLKREVLEELCVDIKPSRIIGIYPDYYESKDDATVNIYYECSLANGKIIPQSQIAEVEWFSLDALPADLAFRHVMLVLEEYRRQGRCD